MHTFKSTERMGHEAVHEAPQTAPEALAKQLASHYCTPSFRDLQRTCRILQAKADAAYEHNAQLAAELEETRESSRRDTLRLAMMVGDLETRLAADADDRAAKEAAHAANAKGEVARLQERTGLLEAGLATAERRETWLLDELREGRTNLGAARQHIADLRAEAARLSAELQRSEEEREELIATHRATRSELAVARGSLDAECRALGDARAQAAQLHSECREANRALDAAREANEALANRAEDVEQEARRLAQRAQQLGHEARSEAEAHAASERAAFALREQNTALVEEINALRRQLLEVVQLQRATKQEGISSRAEARALAIRLGLYRSVLKTDAATILAS